jgi:tRNA threonylcarbamoyladenosine biosynthesis protein TsaE
METRQYKTESEAETIQLGYEFASNLKPGDTIAMYGELGSGKTQFIKGLCKYFKVGEIVTSPTFTIINQYFGTIGSNDITIYHIDLYRIKNIQELEEIGFVDCLMCRDAIKIVEWAEKADEYLRKANFVVRIKPSELDEDTRQFSIEIRK